MKKLLFVSLFLVSVFSGKAQTSFWINNTSASAGTVIIPVYVSGFDSVITMALGLNCSANLTYTGYQNVSPQLSMPVFNYSPNNEIVIAVFSINCMSIPDSTIAFELVFDFSGGMGSLTWNLPNCSVGSCGPGSITPSFTNGYINPATGTGEPAQMIDGNFAELAADCINFRAVVRDFKLYDIFGQLILSDRNTRKVDLTLLRKGLYLAVSDNRITKIIIQ